MNGPKDGDDHPRVPGVRRKTELCLLAHTPRPPVVAFIADHRLISHFTSARSEPDPATPGGDSVVVIRTKQASLLGKRFMLDGRHVRIGRDGDNQIVLDGDSTSRHHAHFELRDDAWWVVDDGSTNGTYVNDELCRERRLWGGDRVEVGPALFEYRGAADPERLYREAIYRSSHIDDLTQAHGKRHLFEAIEKEALQVKTRGGNLALAVLGIDHFRKLNDDHGDIAGDVVLNALAQVVRRSVRRDELLARYGGDELALMLPETPLADACARAERLRQQIEQAKFLFQGDAIPITVSIGVAALAPGSDTAAALVRAADERLAEAKHGGRNRVVS